jgi:hypothetical protein
MNPLAPNANMLSELREKRLQKAASTANVRPEPTPTPSTEPTELKVTCNQIILNPNRTYSISENPTQPRIW